MAAAAVAAAAAQLCSVRFWRFSWRKDWIHQRERYRRRIETVLQPAVGRPRE